jgi:hypothetical protein
MIFGSNMIFGSFINWCIYLFLVYEYLKNKFPEKTQDFVINMSYYSIYLFSKLQIFLNKSRNEVYLYLENNENCRKYIQKGIEIKSVVSNKFLYIINTYFYNNSEKNGQKNSENKKETIIFDFILNNKINFSMGKEELINNLESTVMDSALLDSCDFVLIRNSTNNIKIINKDQITFTNLTSEDSTLYKIVPINYKPLLCEMIVDSKNMKISFTDRDDRVYNYLVVDNKFDSKFIKYFMKEHFKFILKDDTEYELQILDNNVENISIRENDILKIEENKMVKL